MSLGVGCLVATPDGQVRVEDIRPGHLVYTRGAAALPVRDVRRRHVARQDLVDLPHRRPVRIAEDAMGEGLPERDIIVSPNHRFLLHRTLSKDLYGVPEVLMAARHLTFLAGITRETPPSIEYVHLLFDWHEVVLSDGCWSECFHPAAVSTRGLGDAQRGEVLGLFPSLAGVAADPTQAQDRPHLRPVDRDVLLLE